MFGSNRESEKMQQKPLWLPPFRQDHGQGQAQSWKVNQIHFVSRAAKNQIEYRGRGHDDEYINEFKPQNGGFAIKASIYAWWFQHENSLQNEANPGPLKVFKLRGPGDVFINARYF